MFTINEGARNNFGFGCTPTGTGIGLTTFPAISGTKNLKCHRDLPRWNSLSYPTKHEKHYVFQRGRHTPSNRWNMFNKHEKT